MAYHNQQDDQTNDPKRPSQAEGTPDRSSREQSRKAQNQPREIKSGNDRTNDPQRPSQAEGDRETIDESLDKGQ